MVHKPDHGTAIIKVELSRTLAVDAQKHVVQQSHTISGLSPLQSALNSVSLKSTRPQTFVGTVPWNLFQ